MPCFSNGRASIRNIESDTYVWEQWRSFANTHSVTAATLFDEVFRRFPGWKKPSERGADYAGPAEDDDWDSEPDDEAEILRSRKRRSHFLLNLVPRNPIR